MKEFVEKLIGRLEELITDTYYKSVEGSRSAGIENNAYHNVRKIVNQLAEEYLVTDNDQDMMIIASLPSLYPMMQPFEVEAINRVVSSAKHSVGWISCSEDKPKKNGWYECWYMTSAVGENKYYEPITLYWEDNIWLYRPNKFTMPTQSNVVAWKPIAPYQPKGE